MKPWNVRDEIVKIKKTKTKKQINEKIKKLINEKAVSRIELRSFENDIEIGFFRSQTLLKTKLIELF